MKKLFVSTAAVLAALAMPMAATAHTATPAGHAATATMHAASTHLASGAIRPHYAALPSHISRAAALAQADAGTTIPMFSSSVNDGGTPFSYTMVGNDPSVTEASPSTTVPTFIINTKIKVVWDGDVYNPSAPDPCDPAGKSALTRVKASPLFKNHGWKFGGVSVGSTQYVDAFQRAEFYKFTGPKSINPGYHVLMSAPTVLNATVRITGIPEELLGSCLSDPLLILDINQWDTLIQTQLLPQLASLGVTPATYPIFLLHNVAFSDGTQCCALGYHSAFGSPAQVYAVGDYDTTGAFGSAVQDVTALSHEVGETWNDPLVNNATDPWGNIGQVTGCQSNLEVADPLTGSNIPVTMGTFTYHPQEMAFFSWFFHQSPSIGINGWYSDNDTFTTPAAACS